MFLSVDNVSALCILKKYLLKLGIIEIDHLTSVVYVVLDYWVLNLGGIA